MMDERTTERLTAIRVSAEVDEEMTTDHVRWLLDLVDGLVVELGGAEGRAVAAESAYRGVVAREDALVADLRAVAAGPEPKTTVMLDPNRMAYFAQGALDRTVRGESIAALLLDPSFRRAAGSVAAMIQASDRRAAGQGG